MNVYANLERLKRALRIAASVTTHDAYLLELSEAASRSVENFCQRHFYTVSEVRYFGVLNTGRVLLDDLLSVSAVGADSEEDGTFDGEAWVEGTDYVLFPRDKWPRTWMAPHKAGEKSLSLDGDYLKVTGVWGFGDGQSGSPWRGLGVTLTVADGTATSATVSASGAVSAGDTLKVESEQVYVESVSGTTLTIRRGMNGTTGAAHAAAAVSRALYPEPVIRFVVALVSEEFGKRTARGVRQEMLGTHQVVYEEMDERIYRRALGVYRRVRAN